MVLFISFVYYRRSGEIPGSEQLWMTAVNHPYERRFCCAGAVVLVLQSGFFFPDALRILPGMVLPLLCPGALFLPLEICCAAKRKKR